MTRAGQLTRRVTFQRMGVDANGDPLGAWETVVSRDAKVMALKTGAQSAESVINMRLEGLQPVVIAVRRDTVTRAIDNAYRAFDARAAEPPSPAAVIWNLTSAIWNEADDMMEFLAVQRRGGSDA